MRVFRRILFPMEENIIDLKKRREERGSTATNENFRQVDDDFEEDTALSAPVLGDDADGGIEWEADEYDHIPKSGYWYAGLASVAFLLLAVGIIAKSYFFIVFVVLAAVLLIYYAKRPPKRIVFSVGREGVSAGAKKYPYQNLKSFWIFVRDGRADLSLETKSSFNPMVMIPLESASADNVREMLLENIEEIQHIENLFDRIMRVIGL